MSELTFVDLGLSRVKAQVSDVESTGVRQKATFRLAVVLGECQI